MFRTKKQVLCVCVCVCVCLGNIEDSFQLVAFFYCKLCILLFYKIVYENLGTNRFDRNGATMLVL